MRKKQLGNKSNWPVERVGPLDHHEHQPLRVLPRLGLIRTPLDDLLVTLLGRTADGPRQMRRGQAFEHRVRLDSPDETPVFVGQVVERFAVDVAGVEPIIDDVAQTFRLEDDLLQEAPNALRGRHLALPQQSVQKTVPQPMAFVHAVVAAGHAVAGHERMIHGVAVVVVGGRTAVGGRELGSESCRCRW